MALPVKLPVRVSIVSIACAAAQREKARPMRKRPAGLRQREVRFLDDIMAFVF
jgi:hypothetical protein